MNISIHIERLILDGIPIPPGQRTYVQAAVEAELTRLLTEGGPVAGRLLQGGAVPQVSANSIQVTNENNPTRLGQQIAQSVYGGISK